MVMRIKYDDIHGYNIKVGNYTKWTSGEWVDMIFFAAIL